MTVPASSSGTTVNMVVGDTQGVNGPMTLTADPSSVPAGDVTFTVKNTGTIDHEVVVLKTDTAFDKLEVGARPSRTGSMSPPASARRVTRPSSQARRDRSR